MKILKTAVREGRESADCTNFASQVLFAGGIPQISGKRNETSA